MKMTGSQILIETLIEQGTDVVFGYPGGQVLNIYDELYLNSDRISHVLTAHEQGAAHAADGYARATGKVGVVIATSGPGATNLVTGIATAYLDSVPMVAITGNVPTGLLGRDSFQEVDIVGITMPVTKHNYMVKNVADLADTIREAFAIAKSGRPGSVLIDIPKDVQTAQTEYCAGEPAPEAETPDISDDVLKRAAEMINQSEKPYIYCGGGAIRSGCGEEILAIADKIDAPIGSSLMGLSAIPTASERALGMTGMHGTYTSSMAKAESDLILAFGVRFSDRATGDKSRYAEHAKIIHVDIDDAELNKNIPADLGIHGDMKKILSRLCAMVEKSEKPDWHAHIASLREYEKKNVFYGSGKLTPKTVIDMVSAEASEKTPIATDVGQHQMWTAQFYNFRTPRTFISSGGLGTMGFGMGAAIGASVATGERTVLVTGDGSFGMNLNELATAVSQRIPLVVVLMNNGVLGMVRQWQTIFFNKHYAQTTLERKTDFTALAKAFGAEGLTADTPETFAAALKTAFSTDGPVVIDCRIDQDERVLPMIPPNSTVDKMIID